MCSISHSTDAFGLFPTIYPKFHTASEVKLLILFENYVELTLNNVPTLKGSYLARYDPFRVGMGAWSIPWAVLPAIEFSPCGAQQAFQTALTAFHNTAQYTCLETGREFRGGLGLELLK